MTEQVLTQLEALNEAIVSHPACALYFSQPQCGVCHALKPKLLSLFKEQFPNIPFYYIDAEQSPELAAQNQVFTVPTLLVFFEQSEMIRESRHISLSALKEQLERPYSMMFG
ncbi:thioredoxin family protein [Reinekea blandensis]|uniref:Thioredoxin-like protein n=1 Tax=Reinekea blandensis MED297 TaxID=314283 RepID=A4BAH8_9GAMM|nr:thioredoxin family protein [Reinekea blandensis]EAR10934.1 thioredoxin-like protein [Reinekea sp. MED297] [Reinekea blandensis MED297]